MSEAQETFRRLRLLDDDVRFVQGYFRRSLPMLRKSMVSEKRRIAVLYLDPSVEAFHTESLNDALYNLYDLVSVGGWVVCDDCLSSRTAMAAVNAFRKAQGLDDEPLFRFAESATRL